MSQGNHSADESLSRGIYSLLSPLPLLKQNAGPGKPKPLSLPLAAWCAHLRNEDFKGKAVQSNVMESLVDFNFDHSHFYRWNH